MFDNKLVNQSRMCRTTSYCVVWADVFGIQVTDRSFCEVERRFGGRQQRRLIDTDSYSTLCGTVWNKAAGSSSLWDTSFTSPRHQRRGARRGDVFDRWADRVEQIQAGDGEIGRRRERQRTEERGWSLWSWASAVECVEDGEHRQTDRQSGSFETPTWKGQTVSMAAAAAAKLIQEMHVRADEIYTIIYIFV